MLELGKINQEELDSAVAVVDAGLKFEKGNTSSGASMSISKSCFKPSN